MAMPPHFILGFETKSRGKPLLGTAHDHSIFHRSKHPLSKAKTLHSTKRGARFLVYMSLQPYDRKGLPLALAAKAASVKSGPDQ
jgi:hypothetical protein